MTDIKLPMPVKDFPTDSLGNSAINTEFQNLRKIQNQKKFNDFVIEFMNSKFEASNDE